MLVLMYSVVHAVHVCIPIIRGSINHHKYDRHSTDSDDFSQSVTIFAREACQWVVSCYLCSVNSTFDPSDDLESYPHCFPPSSEHTTRFAKWKQEGRQHFIQHTNMFKSLLNNVRSAIVSMQFQFIRALFMNPRLAVQRI
jgi:hypothetical protein